MTAASQALLEEHSLEDDAQSADLISVHSLPLVIAHTKEVPVVITEEEEMAQAAVSRSSSTHRVSRK